MKQINVSTYMSITVILQMLETVKSSIVINK